MLTDELKRERDDLIDKDEPWGGYVGIDLRRRPTIVYLNQTPSNLDKQIYFLAVRFKLWDDNPHLFPDFGKEDMSLSMYRTKKYRDQEAQALLREGNRVIVGELTPRRLIEVCGISLEKNKAAGALLDGVSERGMP